jgi:flagellar hook-length control protein FliK
MFDPQDFLTLFQEGKVSPDSITADFTKALNEALATKRKMDEEAARQKAEAEAARKREELKAALEAAKAKTKMREADDIAARLSAFLKTHYGDILGKVEDMPNITGAQIVETIDESLKVFQEMLKLKDNLETFVKNVERPEKNRPFAVPDPTPAPVDPILEFLKANKLM